MVMSLQGVKHCRRSRARGSGCQGVERRRAPKPRARDPSVGHPIGHVEFVQAQLVSTTKKHATLYERIQSVQDLQSAWLLLLFCANTRATCSLRGLPPNEVPEFAAAHDEASWQCLTKLLSFPRNTDRHSVASLSFDLGGCGLQSAWRTRAPAHWASWADSLRMIHQRHPEVANTMIGICLSVMVSAILHAAVASCEELRAVGYIPPGWRALSTTQPQAIADRLPGVLGIPAEGWQHDASSCSEKFFCDSSMWLGCFTRGPTGGSPIHCCAHLPSQAFRP